MSHITAEEGEALWRAAMEAADKRAMDMPDEQSAVDAMRRAYSRLTELGWRAAIYCPKDGSIFKVIEAGSNSVFDCIYQGEWPHGSWLLFDSGDIWPSRPILFKLLPEAHAAEDARMAHARQRLRDLLYGDFPQAEGESP